MINCSCLTLTAVPCHFRHTELRTAVISFTHVSYTLSSRWNVLVHHTLLPSEMGLKFVDLHRDVHIYSNFPLESIRLTRKHKKGSQFRILTSITCIERNTYSICCHFYVVLSFMHISSHTFSELHSGLYFYVFLQKCYTFRQSIFVSILLNV